MPKGKRIAHATLDATDINKDVPTELAAVGDAGLTLDALLEEIKDRLHGKTRDRLAGCDPRHPLRSGKSGWAVDAAADAKHQAAVALSRDLGIAAHGGRKNTIITHDAGSPRDQLSPFSVSEVPLSYIGWGKTTQLGYGLGIAMGAKLAKPDKLCINVWGDAAIGFTGMDFETAVRERLPILSILMNNFSMAIELKVMPVATEKYRSTDISGNYADFAKALGGYGERVTKPGEIQSRDPPRYRKNPRGHPGAARIHHRKGGRRLALRLNKAAWITEPSAARRAPAVAVGWVERAAKPIGSSARPVCKNGPYRRNPVPGGGYFLRRSGRASARAAERRTSACRGQRFATCERITPSTIEAAVILPDHLHADLDSARARRGFRPALASDQEHLFAWSTGRADLCQSRRQRRARDLAAAVSGAYAA